MGSYLEGNNNSLRGNGMKVEIRVIGHTLDEKTARPEGK